MKRIFSTLVLSAVICCSVSAQITMKDVTDLYNNGATALQNGEKLKAIKAFKVALKAADVVGEDATELANKCRELIPVAKLSIVKDTIRAGKYDKALEMIDSVKIIAANYGNEDIVNEANDLIPQINSSKASSLLNGKDYAEAAKMYKKILEENPDDASTALRLGLALLGAKDTEGAIAAFEKALAGGEEKAGKQLANIYLRQAQASLKSGKYLDCVTNVEKSVSYNENPQAFKLAGNALTKAGKKAESIEYYKKYLESDPKDAGMINYTIGVTYQQMGDKAKAKEYYLKAANDPKLAEQAKKLAAAL